MKKKIIYSFAALLTFVCGCGDSSSSDEPSLVTGLTIKIEQSITQQYSGNIESVRAVEGRDLPSAIAVASKSKVIRYLENDGTQLKNFKDDFVLKNTTYLTEDNDDNELTNSAVFDMDTVLVTYTKLTKNGNKEVTDCGGNLLKVVNANDAPGVSAFDVGPMPDAVAVSPDKRYVLTADEHDNAFDGKCKLASYNPGISIFTVDSAKNINYVKRILFTKNSRGEAREPEYIAVSNNSDVVAVTLQDSYEVAIFKLSEVMAKDGQILDETGIKFVDIPANAEGVKAWPDGIVAFDASHKNYFAMAGEGSDSIIIIDEDGNIISNTQITEKEVPPNYPCLKADWFPGTKYSPDSITAFRLNNKDYVAATLRYAGAVIFYDVSDPAKPVFEMITRSGVGDVVGNGVCTEDNTSKNYPEGISSAVVGDAAYIWVANEGDSSVSSIKVTAITTP